MCEITYFALFIPTEDHLRPIGDLIEVQKHCYMLLHSGVWPPPPLTALNIACFCKSGCMPAYHHFWTTFSSLTMLLDCSGDMLTAYWLKRCLCVKKPAHQIKTSLQRSVDLRISVRLVDIDQSFYVTASATCTFIIFQFIPFNDFNEIKNAQCLKITHFHSAEVIA